MTGTDLGAGVLLVLGAAWFLPAFIVLLRHGVGAFLGFVVWGVGLGVACFVVTPFLAFGWLILLLIAVAQDKKAEDAQ